MSTPTLDDRIGRMERLTPGELKAAQLLERAASMRRSIPHPARTEDDRMSHPPTLEERQSGREGPDREAAQGRLDEQRERGPEAQRHELKGMRERVDQARADAVLSRVRTSSWWDNATAGDLERARRIANEAGAPASSRAAIRNEMPEVAQRRYGTSVDGAIRYERENPQMPPPDLRAGAGRSLS